MFEIQADATADFNIMRKDWLSLLKKTATDLVHTAVCHPCYEQLAPYFGSSCKFTLLREQATKEYAREWTYYTLIMHLARFFSKSKLICSTSTLEQFIWNSHERQNALKNISCKLIAVTCSKSTC